jgi:hypothetical protein
MREVLSVRNRSRIVLTCLAFITCLIATPYTGVAGTVGQMLVKDCSNGSSLEAAANSADEAEAVNDDDATNLAREAARQYYRCAHVANDPYVHDWARFFYFVYLWSSLKTKGDVCNNGEPVLDGLSELAAGSTFSDVRSAATEAYNRNDHYFEQISV